MKKYGLIGYPLEHSFSRQYFNKKFRSESIEAVYENYPIEDISGLRTLISRDSNLHGLNVTIPHKVKVMEYLDETDSKAKAAGAVNVIKIGGRADKRKLTGYNTDVDGFLGSLMPLLDDSLNYKALVLGTGGASMAVQFALRESGIDFLTVSRSSSKADLTYSDLDKEIVRKNRLIINTTPLGMYPEINSRPEIPYEILDADHILFDLVYNPEETVFLKEGRKRGCITRNGLEMLVLQAEKAWEIWSGVRD